MAFDNYNDLKAGVANWLARDDLTTRIPEFIKIAESAFNRELRVRAMEQRATTTTTTEVYYAWPSDLLEIRSIFIQGTRNTVLTYITPEQVEAQNPQETGTPRYWSDIQASLRLWPQPTEGLTIAIDYYKKLNIASDTNNWLLSRHPDIYLYGSLMQAEPYLMNDARVETWRALLTASADQLQREEWRVKAGASPRRVVSDYMGA